MPKSLARRKHRRQRSRRLETLEPRLTLDSTVVFSEIMYNPVDETANTEWVELHNQMAVNMDLSGWTIGGIGYQFPDNTTIPGHGYIVVAKDPVMLEAQAGISGALGPFSGRLANGGERLTLQNASDRVMNVVNYSDESPWPVGADGTGATLAKMDPQASSDDASHWTASPRDGGTPGAANFPRFDPTPSVSTLIPAGASWAADVSGQDLSTEWRDLEFDDGDWKTNDATFYAGRFPTIEPPPDPNSRVGQSIAIANPSFEANVNGGVGYGDVDGWTRLGSVGVNPSSEGSEPFADNGAVPDVRQIGFIQGRGSLSQIIDGLEVGNDYWLELHYNARDCCGARPSMVVSLAGTVLVSPTSVSPVGDDEPYHVTIVPFTATAESGQLLIRNVGAAGDHTLLLDSIAITPRDASDVLMQNPSFEASGNADPDGGPLAGWTYAGDGRYGVTAGGSVVDNGMIPDGRNVVFLEDVGTLTQRIGDLVPGTEYEVHYRANARSATDRPELTIRLDDVTVSRQFIEPVGADQPFHLKRHRFIATGDVVKLDFAQSADTPAANATLLIDDVTVRPVTSPLTTEVALGATTFYYRHEFEFEGQASQTGLTLDAYLDDGAVVFLNGVEIHRQNLPAGEVRADSLAQTTVGDPSWIRGLPVSSAPLRQGRNVLAVEVHQASSADADMAFDLTLAAAEHPVDMAQPISTLRINELTGAAAANFSVELINQGRVAVDLAEYELLVGGRAVPLPAQSLQPTALQVISTTTPVDPDDLVVLRNMTFHGLVDAMRVAREGKIRVPDGDGVIYNVATPSLGSGNQVDLNSSVVINEIMYHHSPTRSKAAVPPEFERSMLIGLDGSWRFNETGEALPADWHRSTHPLGGDWRAGTGLLGFETGRVIPPGIGTELKDADIITYYFETTFDVTAAELQDIDAFQFRHASDDGIILYLNGTEFFRFNMPDGMVDANTLAERSVNNAELSEFLDIPPELIAEGSNRISAELHQSSRSSSDVVFGMEISAAKIVDHGIPATPFIEHDEEWIELLNAGTSTVDLSGWSLDDAVEFRFAEGTLIQPGQFLVVAYDAALLSQKYPGIDIAGDFRGRLNNDHERIVLRDALKNPVDSVQYFEGGRWSDVADGDGASLELTDPIADNGVAEAWAASRPRAGGDWKTYSYRSVASEPQGLSAPAGDFHELIIGLLDAGEILLDDVRLIEDPDGEAIDRLQNGSFEADVVGESPDAWRIIGTHGGSAVVTDPENDGNQVLRLSATGPAEHMHNHGETTLADGVRIDENQVYEFSFRAKWVSGSPQLNTRLYYNRAARTTTIDTTSRHGTPGLPNSVLVNNAGPTYRELAHAPVVPAGGEDVSVSVEAADPQGVSQMVLHYAVDRDPFVDVVMSLASNGRFQGTIPGQPENTTVQFYVTGTDTTGARSHFPSRGGDSRAVFVVDSELNHDSAHSMRLVMTRTDISTLHRNTNVMSNARLGATLIYNDQEVFYDVGVRLRASGFGRGGQLAGFNIRFDPQQLFRGVHRSISLDRGTVISSGNGGGVQGVPGASAHELMIYQIAHHAGGIPGMYDDVVYIDAPRGQNTGYALLKMARYTDVYLDSQYENGGDGSLFKYELIYYSDVQANRNPEAEKRSPNRVVGTDISDLGDDKEAYRLNFILKNNRDRDDFDSIIRLGQAFSLRGDDLDQAAQTAMDVDQWMRVFAMQSLVGTADTYNMGLAHNLVLYARPSDGKVLALPWDVDHGFFYASNSNILGRGGSNLQRIINLPHNRRLFYKHLHDIVQTTYNTGYLTSWAQHYSEITQRDLTNFFVNYVDGRSQYVLSRLERVAPQIPFEIASNDGNAFQVDDHVVILEGTGWIDIHTIGLEGAAEPLDVRWLDGDRWQATLPLQAGQNELRLQAKDFHGNPVGADSISVNSTVDNWPLREYLRVVEVMYNPAGPTASELATNPAWGNEDFEFIELMNISPSDSLDLRELRFTSGPADVFSFSDAAVTSLEPGGRVVLVSNAQAFAARYGDAVLAGGQYTGNLRNSGERIRFEDGDGAAVVDFTYDDALPWPLAADGDGFSLELADPLNTPVGELSNASHWRASAAMGGSPLVAPASGDLNRDGQLTVDDIDHFCARPADDPRFDLNGDGQVSLDDLTLLVEGSFGTTFGDVNLDGLFDSSDLVVVFQAGQFEDDVAGNSSWVTGDWNCDGEFGSGDLVSAFQAGGYTAARPATGDFAVAASLDALERRTPAQNSKRATPSRVGTSGATRGPVDLSPLTHDLVFEREDFGPHDYFDVEKEIRASMPTTEEPAIGAADRHRSPRAAKRLRPEP